MNIAYLCTSKSLGGLELNHLRNASWMQARSHTVLCLFTEGSSLALEAKKMALKQQTEVAEATVESITALLRASSIHSGEVSESQKMYFLKVL